MISARKRFLFIHVPKTGGNSIQNILRNYSEDRIVLLHPLQDGVERFEIRNDKYNITKHATLSHYKTELEPDLFQRLFKFATIRNPWEMIVSYYFSPIRGPQRWDRQAFIKLVDQLHPLRHYITLGHGTAECCRNSQQTQCNTGTLDADIDFLMRFEMLSDDFGKVCKRIDIPVAALPVRNRSRRKHYSFYYDEELEEKVRG